jgi:hypothetical protein
MAVEITDAQFAQTLLHDGSIALCASIVYYSA